MKWRIYYGDGSTYFGDPYLAPATNVQVIAQEAPWTRQGYILVHGKDAYCYREGEGWYGVSQDGLWDYLFNYRGPKAIIFGRTMARTPEFHACVRRASEEGLG